MFTIYGGKAAFDQWDQGQRVACQGMKAGDKVTFTNCTGETHPMLSYTYEGIVVCDVPNDMLMMAVPILVDLCRSHEHRTRLLVNAKEKPEGYVYIDNTKYQQTSVGAGSGDNGFDCTTSWNDLTDNPFSFKTGDKAVAEEWAFTLEDGTTVTKKVLVVE